jgi:hypothetical protein
MFFTFIELAWDQHFQEAQILDSRGADRLCFVHRVELRDGRLW